MNRKQHFLRLASLAPCLALAACLADGNQPAPQASAVSAKGETPVPAVSAAPVSAPTGRRAVGGGSGAGGGATTAAARAAPAVAAEDYKDPLTQARIDCWMKVEHEKNMKDIDRRIAFVDKCVTATMKGQ